MKRVMALLLSVVLLAGMVTACSSSTSVSTASESKASDSSAPKSTESGTSATTTEKKGKVTLTFFTGKVETIDVMNEIINAFNASQDRITVVQEYQKDASNVIKIKFASGDVPDIMTTYEQEYADQGKYLDLSGETAIWDRLIPSMKVNCTDINSGKQYRIATNMTMAGLFYNKTIFNELGLTTATTWDQLVSNLQTIKDKKPDVTPWFIFGSEAWHLGHLIEFIPHGYLKQKYGTLEIKKAMLSNDQSILDFGSPTGSMAVFAQNLLDLKDKGLINSDVLTATSDNCVQDFATGKAAMLSNGMWVLSGILAANPDMASQIGFAPYPAYMPDSKPVVLCAEDSGYSISAETKNPEECKEFLAFLFTAENQKKYSEALGAPSGFTDVDAKWAPEAIVTEVNSALKSAVNIGFTNEKPAGFTGDDAGRLVQDLLTGKYTAVTFAEAYKKAWDAGFGS